jgi:hypothetical protein
MSAQGRQRRGDHQSAAGREAAAVLLLVEDVRMAMLLLNEARYRALERMLGVGRSEANLVTFVAAAVLVDAVNNQSSKISSPGAPKPDDVALSAALAGTALSTVAGSALGGPGSLLIAGAIIYRLVAPPSRRAARGIARAPFRLRKAVMAQGQQLAAAAAARAREAAAERSSETPTTTVTPRTTN